MEEKEGEVSLDVFWWRGSFLPYFDHPYNRTMLNMRRIEIPIASWHVAQAQRRGQKPCILEVGNVLAHYGEIDWPVVDLHEQGAINMDVMEYEPEAPVDLLICISTIEHMDHNPVDVMHRFRAFLSARGTALVTAPTQYNGQLDDALRAGTLKADIIQGMRHTGDHEWWPCTVEEALVATPRPYYGKWRDGMVGIYLCGNQGWEG